MRITALAGREATPALRGLVDALDPEAPSDYRELAALLALAWREAPPRRVGLGGGQGAGKSTLARLVADACTRLGITTCVLGLDDYYLDRSARRRLAESTHPLLETRGPPGTHDVALLRETLQRLEQPGEVEIPIFDKGLDDRAGWRRVRGPFDLVVLEGWCVGAAPLDPSSLVTPCNALEAREDPTGEWRRFMAAQLAEVYAPLWQEIEAWVVLAVPDLESVRRWRAEQEAALPSDRRMNAEGLERFVQHFERVTLSMASQPRRPGEITVELGPDHRIVEIEWGEGNNGSPGSVEAPSHDQGNRSEP
jgi:D-glycerate 3-kinase